MQFWSLIGGPVIVILAFLNLKVLGFANIQPSYGKASCSLSESTTSRLCAKKSTAKGFGKATSESNSSSGAGKAENAEVFGAEQKKNFLLQSVAEGGSPETPKIDQELSPEERAKLILKEKYGLKSMEEQQAETKQRQAIEEQRKKLNEWKKNAASDRFDIMTALPPSVLVGIDSFLKIGLGTTSVLFVLGGIGITVEAYSKATGKPLPVDVDQFLVNVVEPNFTPGLFVLLGFSVSLGLFAAAQLGSQGATYREDK